ncbi:MAG: hypothetical protein IJC11_04365 [Alphaproteobacteria bacterium]|nr:hypothetical protein [Alphaproteobacteria bacterium]MBQ3117538.1 hypothetical protein [Alphaproteobacteria bacterium]MBQ6853810.1 hypothetical protein [Alphaproteobacteria bacterium]MBQ8557458.1 hypothetical protein [Alphaproteobacteria bacterium]
MKLVVFFKILVTVMTLLLVSGFALVLYKVADKQTQSKLKTQSAIQQPILSGISEKSINLNNQANVEQVISMVNCGEDICLLTSTGSFNQRLIVIHPQSRTVKQKIVLKDIFE